MKYTIHNPTKSVRVIHDGIEGSQRQYTLQPGETRTGIALSDTFARELRERTRKPENRDADLRLQSEDDGEQRTQPQQQPAQHSSKKR